VWLTALTVQYHAEDELAKNVGGPKLKSVSSFRFDMHLNSGLENSWICFAGKN